MAPRCVLVPRCRDPPRLPQRSTRVLLVADAGVATDAARAPDPLSRGRLAARSRAGAALARGLPRLGPVRIGNGAARQLQLDVYGGVLETIWLYVQKVGHIDGDTGKEVARIADWVATHWRDPDSGIWEVRSEPTHFIQSKAFCWVALDRACRLGERGAIPDRSVRWRAAGRAARVHRDPGLGRGAGDVRTGDRPARAGREPPDDAAPRLRRPEGRADLLHDRHHRARAPQGPVRLRYLGDDGVGGSEGAFLTCSSGSPRLSHTPVGSIARTP